MHLSRSSARCCHTCWKAGSSRRSLTEGFRSHAACLLARCPQPLLAVLCAINRFPCCPTALWVPVLWSPVLRGSGAAASCPLTRDGAVLLPLLCTIKAPWSTAPSLALCLPRVPAGSAAGKGNPKGDVPPLLMFPRLRGWTTTPGVQRAGRSRRRAAAAGELSRGWGRGRRERSRALSPPGEWGRDTDIRGGHPRGPQRPARAASRPPGHPLRTRADRHRLQALLLRAGGAAGARAGPRVCRVTLGEAPALGVSGCQSMAALLGGKGYPSASSPRPWEKHRPPAASSAGWELRPTQTHRPVPPRSLLPTGHRAALPPLPQKPSQSIHSTSTEFK